VLTATEHRESNEELAARVFAELQTLLFSFQEGARQGDVESIHDMRVTTRRFRVALSNFAVCVPPDLRERVKVDVNELAGALGRVRDIDVMLQSLPSIETVEPVSRGPIITDLRTRLTRRRRYHHHRLVGYLNSQAYLEMKDLLSELTNGKAPKSEEDSARRSG
jgi:triphosphatase